MPASFLPAVGAVFSADIAVPDHDRVVRFYARVLSTGDSPLWREDDLMNNLGMPIIGIGARTAEYDHLPLQWMPHIQVADVAASLQRALGLGGSVVMHAKDEAGNSQWAVLLDPNGAAFGIIPVVPAAAIAPVPADAAGTMGRIAWLDLTVPDATRTLGFYRQVVGWRSQDVEMDDAGERYADYNLLGEDDEPVAGVCHARGMNAGLPPVWLIYLPVGDLVESLRRVQAEGGRVVKTLQGSDGRVGVAMIQDPVGVSLALTAA